MKIEQVQILRERARMDESEKDQLNYSIPTPALVCCSLCLGITMYYSGFQLTIESNR